MRCRHAKKGGSHGDHAGQLKEHVNDSLKKVGATDEQKVKICGVLDQIDSDVQQLRISLSPIPPHHPPIISADSWTSS